MEKEKPQSKFGLIKDPRQIQDHIILNKDKLFKIKPSEEYRKPIPGIDVTFQEKGFMDLKVDEGKNKINLMTYINYPKDRSPKGVIYIFHGMGSFSGKAASLANSFSDIGLVAVAFDYRGYGNSEGESGLIETWDILVNDAIEFINKTDEFLLNKYKTKIENRFLTGQSMGGLLAWQVTEKLPSDFFKGVVFFAPAFETWNNSFSLTVIKMIGAIFTRRSVGKSENLISKNPNALEKTYPEILKNDTKLGTVRSILNGISLYQDSKLAFNIPFVMIVSGVDKRVTPQSGLDFYNRAKTKDKEIWYYPNLWHDIWGEDEIEEIKDLLQIWLKDRI